MDAATKATVKLVTKEIAKGTVLDLTARVGILLGFALAGLTYGMIEERKEARTKNTQKD